MKTRLCIANLTESADRIEPDLPSSDPDVLSITSLDQVPQDESLLLYIVSHGIPDALVSSPNEEPLGDGALAATIKSRRRRPASEGESAGHYPTLIVWDVCFAKSMLRLPKGATWPSNFAHIFSCQSFERTWHSGRSAAKPPRTVFSTELRKAIQTVRSQGEVGWAALQETLRVQLRSLQQPEIEAPSDLQPTDFELDKLIR